jgi:hypothetical protein
MGNSSSPAKILASLFRLTNEVRPVLLLGAGASFDQEFPSQRKQSSGSLKPPTLKTFLVGAYIRDKLS